MKEYQIISDAGYVLPTPVYHQCIWIIRDMERLSAVAEESCLTEAVLTARSRLECISSALSAVPAEYRAGILDSICSRGGSSQGVFMNDYACINTWKKWKQIFIYTLARNLSLY